MRATPHPVGLALLLVLLTPACGGTAYHTTPEGTVERFAAALRSKQYGAAYEMMAPHYRRRVSEQEFRLHLQNHPLEAQEIAEALVRLDDAAEITATLPTGDTVITLIEEDGEWRIRGNIVDFYDQSTPRAALRSFVRAMERRRYDVVMRFVPKRDLEGMSPERMRAAWDGDARDEIDRLLAALRAHLDNPIEVVGNRATMPYGGGRFTVQFIREDGLWKIEDPD